MGERSSVPAPYTEVVAGEKNCRLLKTICLREFACGHPRPTLPHTREVAGSIQAPAETGKEMNEKEGWKEERGKGGTNDGTERRKEGRKENPRVKVVHCLWLRGLGHRPHVPEVAG